MCRLYTTGSSSFYPDNLLGDLLSFLDYVYVANFQPDFVLAAILLLSIASEPILIPTCSCHWRETLLASLMRAPAGFVLAWPTCG